MSVLGQKQTFAQPTLRAELPLLKVSESRIALGLIGHYRSLGSEVA